MPAGAARPGPGAGGAAPARFGRAAVPLSAAIFCLLATLNTGGYRFGVSDQAFYLPAVLRQLDPALFPRDGRLLATQDRLMQVDEIVAAAARATGADLPTLFLAGYLAALLLLWSGGAWIGTALFRSPWTVGAFLAALTLRHRIAETAVNTLEGYFHPRMAAFGLGLLAVGAFLRARDGLAGALLVVAGLVHPTIALWYGVWLAAAAVMAWRPGGRATLALAASGVAALAAALLGPMRDRLVVMDPAWTSVLASKDYLFPGEWPPGAWLLNLASPAIVLAAARARARAGVAFPRERAILVGSLALAAVFLASLPFVSARLALAVQLQVSRVFWMLDVLATACVLWWAMESPGRSTRLRMAMCLALATASATRGAYVTYVEQARALVRVGLPSDDWTDAMAWLSRTPPATHVLADPGHAWKYGTSVRVAAGRDVFLEEVKDSAMAIYGRDVAVRVAERTRAIGDFTALTPVRARELARDYGLDYLVTERPLDLPVAYRNARFTIHALP